MVATAHDISGRVCRSCGETKRLTEYAKTRRFYRLDCHSCFASQRRACYDPAKARARYDAAKVLPGFKESRASYVRTRRHSDPEFNFATICRSTLRGKLKYGAVNGGHYCAFLGATPRGAIQAITGGLSSIPVGLHIDHYVPVVFFDLTNPAERLVCFNWRNVRFVPPSVNRAKRAKLPPDWRECVTAIREALSLDGAAL